MSETQVSAPAGTRDQVYAAIDGERDHQDLKNPNLLALGEEIALVMKYALLAFNGPPDQEVASEPWRRETFRELAAFCVRALERYGAPVRTMVGPIGAVRRPYEPGTRSEVYAAIDSQLDYLDERGRRTYTTGQAAMEALASATAVLEHWSNEPFDPTELMARVKLRDLAATLVRLFEDTGVPLRQPDPPPPPPRDRDGWKAGVDAKVVAFVDEAERSFNTISPSRWADLRDYLEELKSGVKTLESPLTMAEWVAKRKDHH